MGGGLAGLAAALDLRQRGHAVTLVERKQYPFHKVCGEYVSNEVLPYLRRLEADPAALLPATITHLEVSAPGGRLLAAPLDLGGFGVSRYALDDYLCQRARARGVTVLEKTTVAAVAYDATTDQHRVTLSRRPRAYCPRGAGHLRQAHQPGPAAATRRFSRQRSPYLGVKYHLRLPGFPRDVIALHNFADGYAGISAIEEPTSCASATSPPATT